MARNFVTAVFLLIVII